MPNWIYYNYSCKILDLVVLALSGWIVGIGIDIVLVLDLIGTAWVIVLVSIYIVRRLYNLYSIIMIIILITYIYYRLIVNI